MFSNSYYNKSGGYVKNKGKPLQQRQQFHFTSDNSFNVFSDSSSNGSLSPSDPNSPRSPVVAYKTKMCRSVMEGQICRFQDNCTFAHSIAELRYGSLQHPKYKTKPCNKFFALGYCPFGDGCLFMHALAPHKPFDSSMYHQHGLECNCMDLVQPGRVNPFLPQDPFFQDQNAVMSNSYDGKNERFAAFADAFTAKME